MSGKTVGARSVSDVVKRWRPGILLAALVLSATAAARAKPCATCHADVAAEWEASSHHRSATNAAYVAQLAREPLPFCRGCHAPAANPERPTPAVAAQAGIGCTDCHTGLPAKHAKGQAPPARACEGCHEFAFPRGTDLMQKTASEHRGSAFASTACSSCHLPPRNGHRDHRFEVEPLVAQAIVVDVARAGPGRLAFRLAPGMVGHAFPTGDLFRRLAVRVGTPEGGRVAERFLGRELVSKTLPDGNVTRVEVRDDRVGAGLTPCFELKAPAGPAAVEIALERVDDPSTGRPLVVRSRSIAWQSIIPPDAKDHPCR